MFSEATLLSLLFALGAKAQQAGTSTAETRPSLPISQCTAAGSCSTLDTSVVLDANWRWVHTVGGYTNCYTGNKWDTSICTSPDVCAQNCALDGADYPGTYGITSSNGALTLKFVTGSNVGSRTYLMNAAGTQYQTFNLKNKEFTFDVDVSNLPCGLNGALYFVEMPADGGLSTQPNNKAGAKYGTGYCDSQCPQDVKFIGGKANINGWTGSSNDPNSGTGSLGACCAEMDVWEANSISSAYTPHPCKGSGYQVCNTTTTCGSGDGNRYNGICDKDGCDFNSYRMGNTSFYGPGDTVNTNSKFTVVTQFITADGTDTGALTEIRRLYVQNGKVIKNSASDISGVSGNSITSSFCSAQKKAFGDTDSFGARGGLQAMGDAMARGMVLVLSVWDDHAANMLWLDSTYPVGGTAAGNKRGTCDAASGVPATVEGAHPGASVTWSAIKFGKLNSTYSA